MASEIKVDTIVNAGGDNDSGIDLSTNDVVAVKTANSERARIDANGNMLLGKTSLDNSTVGARINATGDASFVRSGAKALFLNRTSSDGEICLFAKDNTTAGEIGNSGTDLYIASASGVGIFMDGSQVLPCNASGTTVDDDRDLGSSSKRWRDIYTNGAVTTSSDQNEKQDIANLSSKELKVANKLSALFKTYRWKDRVAEKGDKARTHSGIIAQDIQSAFSAEGLDASNYGMFISNTWTDEEGKEKTRLAVRYTELFSFIFSSIEARLTALESK